jgi:uncharacterized protein YcnI
MRAWVFTVAMLVPAAASAHITLEIKQAEAGSYYQAMFDVPHGCAGSATTQVTVEIPEGIVGAKPQPKPGWTLSMAHETLDHPLTSESGRAITERVSSVTWRGGPLPDDEFDRFLIILRLPGRPGPLYFPTVQTCVVGETHWTDTVPPGKTWRDVPHPPPFVTLTQRP